MAYMESPLEVYLSGRDLKRAYKERRWSIRQRLPTMTMHDLQRKKADYDEYLQILQEKLENVLGELDKVKAGATRFKLEGREFCVGHPTEAKEILQIEIERLKTGKKWVRRERQIYTGEILRRMLKAVKLPVLKLQLSQNEAAARRLLSQIGECSQRLLGLCEEYNRTYNAIYNACKEISLLSDENPQIMVPSLDLKVLHLAREINTRLTVK